MYGLLDGDSSEKDTLSQVLVWKTRRQFQATNNRLNEG